MIVRLQDIPFFDAIKGLIALFLCLGVWWYFNRTRLSLKESIAWIALLIFQVGIGIGTYWYQTNKYADSEGGDAGALFLNATKLLDLRSESPADFWSLIATGKPQTIAGETAIIHMKIWNKSNHYGLGNEKQRMVRATALLLFISGRSYSIVFICFILIAWIAIQMFDKALTRIFKNTGRKFIWPALFLSPSTLMWSSVPGKESLLLLGSAGIFWGISASKSHRLPAILWLSLGIFLMVELRVFLLVCALPATVFWVVVQLAPYLNKWASALIGLGIPLIALLMVQVWAWKHQPSVLRSAYQSQEEYERQNGESYARQVQQPGLNILEKLKFKRLDLEVEALQKNPATGVRLRAFDGSLKELIAKSPIYLIRGMTGYEWFLLDWKYWIWGLERLVFFAACLVLLWAFITEKYANLNVGQILLWSLSLCFLMGLLMPVLGNISRYLAVIHLPLLGMGIGHFGIKIEH